MSSRVRDDELPAERMCAAELAREDRLWQLLAEVLGYDAQPELEVLDGGRPAPGPPID